MSCCEIAKLATAFFVTEIGIFLILCVTIFYKYDIGLKCLASGYTALLINTVLWAVFLSFYKKENIETDYNLQEVSLQN